MRQLEVISPADIFHARRRQYLDHTTVKTYPTFRGLAEYDSRLTRQNGKSVIGVIEGKIVAGADTMNVLDIGCGKGNMLDDLVQRYPQVKAFGLSAFNFRSNQYQLQEHAGRIDYRIGDAHKLDSIFSDVDFDLIVSVHGTSYSADPLAVLRKAYSNCKDGGIVMFDKMGTHLTQSQAELLQEFWQQNGIQANLHPRTSYHDEITRVNHSITLQRVAGISLPLPFKYSPIERSPVDGHAIVDMSLKYDFDEERIRRKMRSMPGTKR